MLKGGRQQAIGRSRGGRSTKIHALTDHLCRPIAFLLTGAQVTDCEARNSFWSACLLLSCCTATRVYGTDLIRPRVEANGTLPNIPPKASRVWRNCFSPVLYRARNAVERMFCRLKDFRRIARRYDCLVTNFLAAVCLAATVSYWL